MFQAETYKKTLKMKGKVSGIINMCFNSCQQLTNKIYYFPFLIIKGPKVKQRNDVHVDYLPHYVAQTFGCKSPNIVSVLVSFTEQRVVENQHLHHIKKNHKTCRQCRVLIKR